jgi:di/tricarboxylate transporter
METSSGIFFVIMLSMITLFFWQLIPIELTALTGIIALVLFQFITPEQAFSGFSSPVVVAMFSMFALGAALSSTGITDRLAVIVFRLAQKNEALNVALVMMLGVFFSSFMNNVAAVALLLPVVASISLRARIPQSRLLMPLSYATILGGMCTLIGTSPNLMAAEILRTNGYQSFSLLSFLPFGLSAAVVGIVYMSIWGRKRLPQGFLREQGPTEDELPALYGIHDHLFSVKVDKANPAVGKSLSQLGFGHDLGSIIVSILRSGKQILAPTGREVLKAEDELLLAGNQEKLKDWGELRLEAQPFDQHLSSDSIAVFEAVLSPRSQLIGKTLKELAFRERYYCLVLEILRRSAPLGDNISTVPLEFGDGLLLQGPRSRLPLLQSDPDFLLLADVDVSGKRHTKAPFVFFALAIFFVLVIFQILSVHIAAFIAAMIVLLSGALSTEELYRGMSWRMIFFVAAILPLEIAANHTGFSAWLSQNLLSTLGHPSSFVLVALFMFAGSVVSQLIEPSIAVIFLGPVSIKISEKLGVDPHQFLMALTLGASIAFQSPYSQRANLLVMAAGGYQVKDYIRVGMVFSLLVFAVLLAVVAGLY